MIGSIERDETLRVPCRRVDQPSVLYTYYLIHRRVQHEQGSVHGCDTVEQLDAAQVLDELATNAERTTREVNLGLSVGLDGGQRVPQQGLDMTRGRRCCDGGGRPWP